MNKIWYIFVINLLLNIIEYNRSYFKFNLFDDKYLQQNFEKTIFKFD